LFVEKNCTNDKQAADKEIKERIHLLLQRFKKTSDDKIYHRKLIAKL